MIDQQCCALSENDGDAPRFLSVVERRARKVYACSECKEPITVGTRYEYVCGKWDRNISTFRTCLVCVEIRNHFACNGWLYEHIWEDLAERLFPDMRAGGPCFEGLSVAARTKLFDRRLAWLGFHS